MSNICAGIGRGQLEVLDERIESKKKIRLFYEKSFKGIPVEIIPIPNNCESNYWLTVVTIDERCIVNPSDVIGLLEEENIESRPVWKPMSLQPLFSESGSFSHIQEKHVGTEFFKKGICLPSGSELGESQQYLITELISRLFKEN